MITTSRNVRLLGIGLVLAVTGCCSRPDQYVVTYSVWYTLNFDAQFDDPYRPDDGRRVHYEVSFYDAACDCDRTEVVYQSGWSTTVILNPGDQAELTVETRCDGVTWTELGGCWNWDTIRRMEILHDGEVMSAHEKRYDPDNGDSLGGLIYGLGKEYWWVPEPCGVT